MAVSTYGGIVAGAAILIDEDSAEAFLVRRDNDNGDVFRIDTIPFDGVGTSGETVEILHNGDVAIAGSGTQASVVRSRVRVGSGTQSGRMRLFDGLVTYEGAAVHSGTDGNQIRVWNGSAAWNSTGTCSSIVGIQNFIACGGGGGVTSGLVTEAIGNRSKVGFNTNDAGSFTNGYCFIAETPKDTDANHTVANAWGLKVQDQGPGVGVTNSYAIDIDDQTNAAAYAIRTGTGLVEFGDKTVIGDLGLEATGIDINGTTYDSLCKVSDIGGSEPAQFHIHRHSTTLAPVIVTSRANDDTSSHTAVTTGQGTMWLLGSGWTGSHYDLNAGIYFEMDAGTISSTSAPGRIKFLTTPDGTQAPAEAFRLSENKDATFSGHIERSNKMVTASATQTQGQELLVADVNLITTVATTNDVVTMPVADAGREISITNAGANTLQIFPSSGDDIGAGVDTSVTMASGLFGRWLCVASGKYSKII